MVLCPLYKNAMLPIPAEPSFQYLFAIEWEDPKIGLDHSILELFAPGFRDSPYYFARALNQSL